MHVCDTPVLCKVVSGNLPPRRAESTWRSQTLDQLTCKYVTPILQGVWGMESLEVSEQRRRAEAALEKEIDKLSELVFPEKPLPHVRFTNAPAQVRLDPRP